MRGEADNRTLPTSERREVRCSEEGAAEERGTVCKGIREMEIDLIERTDHGDKRFVVHIKVARRRAQTYFWVTACTVFVKSFVGGRYISGFEFQQSRARNFIQSSAAVLGFLEWGRFRCTHTHTPPDWLESVMRNGDDGRNRKVCRKNCEYQARRTYDLWFFLPSSFRLVKRF